MRLDQILNMILYRSENLTAAMRRILDELTNTKDTTNRDVLVRAFFQASAACDELDALARDFMKSEGNLGHVTLPRGFDE